MPWTVQSIKVAVLLPIWLNSVDEEILSILPLYTVCPENVQSLLI